MFNVRTVLIREAISIVWLSFENTTWNNCLCSSLSHSLVVVRLLFVGCIHDRRLSAVCSPSILSGWLSYGDFAVIVPRWERRALLGTGEPYAVWGAHVFGVGNAVAHFGCLMYVPLVIYIYIRSYIHITVKRWIQSHSIYIQQWSICLCSIYICCIYV